MAGCDSLSSRLLRDKDASLRALRGATEGGADGGSDGKKRAKGKKRNTKGMNDGAKEERNGIKKEGVRRISEGMRQGKTQIKAKKRNK